MRGEGGCGRNGSVGEGRSMDGKRVGRGKTPEVHDKRRAKRKNMLGDEVKKRHPVYMTAALDIPFIKGQI